MLLVLVSVSVIFIIHLRYLCSQVVLVHKNEQTQKIISNVDDVGSGTIVYVEFLNMMTHKIQGPEGLRGVHERRGHPWLRGPGYGGPAA